MAVLCVVFWRLIQPWDGLSGRAADLSFENGGVYGSRVGLYCAARAASRRGVQAADRAEADIRTDMERGLLRVPDIFVYRSAALVALLAPFVVFTVVFLLAWLR